MTERMRDIPVKNKELLEILNRHISFRTDNEELFKKNMHLACKGHQKDNPEKWISDEYLRQLISEGRSHSGFPDSLYAYEMRTNQKDHEFFDTVNMSSDPDDIKWRSDFITKVGNFHGDLLNFLGCRNNALSAVYPPNGYIAWHNNANAAAYNFVFTYSETGDGYFKYWDIEKQEIVYMYDKPGWQCKAGYFGSYDEPENIFYHSAASKCWRHTVSFCFDKSEVSKGFREEIIDEISSE
jgi:hypothetical protein